MLVELIYSDWGGKSLARPCVQTPTISTNKHFPCLRRGQQRVCERERPSAKAGVVTGPKRTFSNTHNDHPREQDTPKYQVNRLTQTFNA